ncbi:MAG: hypothetical protein ACUVXI_12120 [bacterium]
MTAKAPPFHIQQNTTPEVLRVLLVRCRDGYATTNDLAQELGMRLGTVQHIIPFVRQAGLLEAVRLVLTDTGIAFHHLIQYSSAMLPEAMHHLLYTAHTFDKAKRFSWAYARVVEALWASGERLLDGEAMAQLVGMVVNEAAQEFDVPVEQIAFSRHSIRGVLNWLRALEPTVITPPSGRTGEGFRRRYFCPVPAFLWAVDFLYRVSNTAYGVRVFLTPERLEQLCRLCVLDPSGLDNVLMVAKRMSDYERGGAFDYGTEGGFGRWILLARPCSVPSLPWGSQ